MSIRYFHYISRYKVDEAFNQVPQGLAERLTVGINSPFIPLSLKADSAPRAETVEAKLEIVEAALRKEGQIGTIASPGPWFSGTMTMICCLFDSERYRDEGKALPEVAFFIGIYADILVALGGSAHHVRRSGFQEDPRLSSNSGEAHLMEALKNESQRLRGSESPPPSEFVREYRRDFTSPTVNLPGAWAHEAAGIIERLPGPGRNVEFVARWLAESTWIPGLTSRDLPQEQRDLPQEHPLAPYSALELDISRPSEFVEYPAILGTPLYVADAPGVRPGAHALVESTKRGRRLLLFGPPRRSTPRGRRSLPFGRSG